MLYIQSLFIFAICLIIQLNGLSSMRGVHKTHHAVRDISPHTLLHLSGSVKYIQCSHVYIHISGGGDIVTYSAIGLGVHFIMGFHSGVYVTVIFRSDSGLRL
jgi:hypothetical protein